MKKLIEKIESTNDIEEKIKLLKRLNKIVNFYLRTYKKIQNRGCKHEKEK